MRRPLCLDALLLFTLMLTFGQTAPTHEAVRPVPRDQEAWKARHDAINQRVRQGPVELIFIGDSITQGWEGAGRAVWARHYAHRNAANLGISGDRTQHVLWRLDHGNIEDIRPKVAVIMIGTNNAAANSARQIADGITAIVRKLRAQLPETKILLLGVFPRGERPNALREKLTQTNSLIAGLHDDRHIFFMDIGANLMNPDGTIYPQIMPDFLHLSEKGYEVWAASIEDKLKELLGEQ